MYAYYFLKWAKLKKMLQFETFWVGIKHLERRKWKLILPIYIWFLYIFSFFEKIENEICKELVNVEVLHFIWLIQHPWKMVRSLPICYVEQSGGMHVLDTWEWISISIKNKHKKIISKSHTSRFATKPQKNAAAYFTEPLGAVFMF